VLTPPAGVLWPQLRAFLKNWPILSTEASPQRFFSEKSSPIVLRKALIFIHIENFARRIYSMPIADR
jgi:hypothetical protein